MSRKAVALVRHCRDDRAGAAIIEFALAGPLLLLLLLGIYDLGHMVYLKSVLHGAVSTAARNAAVEAADIVAADAQVKAVVLAVAPKAEVHLERMSYYDFADIARPESWNDQNGNGRCDNSEGYTDENRNSRWDADVGVSGNGGANDVVMYTVTVDYDPVFINPFASEMNKRRRLTATAVKKNQPFSLQNRYGSGTGRCS